MFAGFVSFEFSELVGMFVDSSGMVDVANVVFAGVDVEVEVEVVVEDEVEVEVEVEVEAWAEAGVLVAEEEDGGLYFCESY